MEEVPKCLKNRSDAYNSRYINSEDLPASTQEFEQLLTITLEIFRNEKVKGVFLDVDIDRFEYIGIAKKFGFGFHHTNENILTMQSWLPTGNNRLPHYASHYIGVGGLVLDFKTGKALLITEKSGHDTIGWKIPGGLVDVGEYVSEAAIREVREETGVNTIFKGILSVREKKNYYFGRNDIYFVTLLEAQSTEINMCEIEVSKCEWVHVEEWAKQNFRVETQRIVCEIARDLIKEYQKKGETPYSSLMHGRNVSINLPTLKDIHFMYVPLAVVDK